MRDQNKTQRYIDMFKWLARCGREGISRDQIFEEYDISDKTLRRDVEELKDLFPFLNICFDRDSQRLYADPPRGIDFFSNDKNLSAHATGKKEIPSAKNQTLKDNPFIARTDIFSKKNTDTIFSGDNCLVHIEDSTRLSISDEEFGILLTGILESNVIDFMHKGRLRKGIPLFFCFYSVRWYVFCLADEEFRLVKFRLDSITQISIPLVHSRQSNYSKDDLREIKNQAVEKIQKSKNIFIDLTSDKEITLILRFFFPKDYLMREIPQALKIIEADGAGGKVTDITISFSGYFEARAFMNNWLGHFQIMEPEEIRVKYIEDLEDALGIL